MTTFIYSLADPATGEVRYIGHTVQSLSDRLLNHIREAMKRTRETVRPKNLWIRKLLANGKAPVIALLEECDGDGWEKEVYHISLARADGLKLLNVSSGGKGPNGFQHTPEFKAAQSRRRAGKGLAPEVYKMLSARMTGRYVSPETRARMSASAKGKIISPETRAKMSAANKLRWAEGCFANRKRRRSSRIDP